MSKRCEIHPDTELVVVTYCPACRGQHGGEIAAKTMPKEARVDRARKAAQKRWGKAKKEAAH